MEEANIKAIFYKYRDKVYGYFISSLGDRELSKDLTQDLFYKLCKREKSLCEIENINSYIFWMAQNIVIDHLRKAAYETEYQNKLIAAWKNSNTPVLHQKPEIETKIDKEYFDELFDHLIDDLTSQQRLIVILSKKEGLSNKLIAQKLGLSPHTVKNHLHQALKALRAKLNQDIDTPLLFVVIYLGRFGLASLM